MLGRFSGGLDIMMNTHGDLLVGFAWRRWGTRFAVTAAPLPEAAASWTALRSQASRSTAPPAPTMSRGGVAGEITP